MRCTHQFILKSPKDPVSPKAIYQDKRITGFEGSWNVAER